jgi:hypothetical protein
MALATAVPADRSLLDTLRLAETAVWAVCTVVVAGFLVACLVGAFVVASRPLGPAAAACLAAAVAGTVAFVASDVVFE